MIPQEMIETLLAPGFSGDGKLANDLLSAFHQGFPIENLRPLLASSNGEARAAAAFIATFLGFELNCLVKDISELVDDDEPGIRSDAIEATLSCTTPADGPILGRVLLRLDDEDRGVRSKTVLFIRLAESWQLRLGVENAALLRPDSAFAMLKEIHGQHFVASSRKVRRALEHPDPIVRRFGAAIAMRPRLVVDEGFVEMALASDDAEVKNLAADCCERHLVPIGAIWSSTRARSNITAP